MAYVIDDGAEVNDIAIISAPGGMLFEVEVI
jgi:hypothetical protein